MNRKQWSPEENDEHEAMLAEVCDATKNIRERVQLFREKVADAVQGRRLWARDLQEYTLDIGAAAYVKSWDKSRREVVVAYNGQILTKPGVVGTTEFSIAGEQVFVQKLFVFMTWDEIERKRTEYLKQIRAYSANVHACDRLLALRDLSPAAANPDEAARSIGTTVEQWLASEAA